MGLRLPAQPGRGLPYISGLLVLNDSETGCPSRSWTAPGSPPCAPAPAPASRPSTWPAPTAPAAIFGCGVQARTSLMALVETLPAWLACAATTLPEATRRFVAEMGERFPTLHFDPPPRAAEAAREADVVVTAIPIVVDPTPDLDAGMLKEGALAVSLDYDSAWTSAAMMACDKFCSDDVGQMLATKEHGVYFDGIPSSIYADLGELAASSSPGARARASGFFDEHGDRRGRHGHGQGALRAGPGARGGRAFAAMTGDVSERNAMHTGICDLWSDEALDAIEGAAFELLLRAGVKVPSTAVRELMLGVGCTLGDADRVRVPAEAVRDALAACPREFTQAARDPMKDLAVDPDPGIVYVHNTGETAVLLDPLTGQSRPSTSPTRWVPPVSCISCETCIRSTRPLSPQDVPGPLVPLFSYLALVSESDKHIGGPGVSLAIQVEYLLKMASVVLGDAEARGSHRLSLYLSPVSPMQLGGEVSEGLVVAARAGAVCQILPAPTAGTTAPAPLAAALAQQHAEVLAAVIVAQAVNPGTPCIYGPRLQASDPRTGTAAWGMPVLGLSAAGGALLARRVGLAADCYGLATDAKVVDDTERL